MLTKWILGLTAAFTLLVSSASSASAHTPPAFPGCPNPGGTLKVKYDSGVHGIPGDSGQFIGSDAVYTLNSDQLVQCFCPTNGSTGIQTNWWKVGQLSQEEIDSLKKQGWIYIPNGADWGLDASDYMAKNLNFNCAGGGNGGFSQPGPGSAPACPVHVKPGTPTVISIDRQGSTAKLTWTSVPSATHYTIAYGTKLGDYPYGVPNTGNVTTFTIGSLVPGQEYFFAVRAVNDCFPGDFSGNGPIGGIGGGDVLGLATTGTLPLIASLMAGGFILLAVSLLLKLSGRRAH